jgi:hypothetical protein
VKIQGVLDWPVPTKVKEVQSFLGFVNFYRRFIKDFSEKARPLHALTRKAKAWAWGPDEDRAFQGLKEAVTSAPVLAFPADAGRFKLECDASNFATGAVLSQLQMDGEFHPVACCNSGYGTSEEDFNVYTRCRNSKGQLSSHVTPIERRLNRKKRKQMHNFNTPPQSSSTF